METLESLLLDKTGTVREALYDCVGEWLLKLPDRYSIGYKILPLLLAGLKDEMPRLKTFCENKLFALGELYQQEWETRLKDEMDYSDGRDDYFSSVISHRPSVGCRHLARDNTQKIVTKLIQDLGHWTL